MAKQKCETCRFFQEAGLAGSGWCHHPQRKTSSGVMVMVRRNELACRNAWSTSLWEPASAADEPGQASLRPLAAAPLPPANMDDLRAVASQDTVIADPGEDVLLSEARLIAEPTRPAVSSHQAPPRPVAAGFDPRTALFRAREAHREKTRAKEAAARQSESIAPGRPADENEAAVVPAAERPSTHHETPAPLPGVVAETGSETPIAVADTSSAMPPAVYAGNAQDDLERWLGEVEPEDGDDAPEPDPIEEELQLASLYKLASEPLPAWFRTDLPTTCRTCRDFRPSAEGERGWCANRWAFGKALGEPQQLVHEDERVPCASPIGHWWAPVDDVWLVAADVSHHSRPTPLMDRYLPPKTVEKKRS